jgi:hypothetical protein
LIDSTWNCVSLYTKRRYGPSVENHIQRDLTSLGLAKVLCFLLKKVLQKTLKKEAGPPSLTI